MRSRPGAAAERSYLASEIKGGQEEPPHVQGQGRRLGGATPNPRPGEAAGRSNPKCKEQWLRGRQEGLEELSHVEGQEGWREEIPLIQGKEQQLHFAGAAMKRYSTPKVRETQIRW